MAIVHLQSGLFEQASENEPSSSVPTNLTRRALLVYEGEFESMDGVVNVGRDELTTLATNHNGHIESASRLAEGKESMKDYPPVQLDHSTSAKDTVGRLIGKLELGEYKTKDGREVMAAYGNVKILGEENVVKVMDGRWTHLSVGVDFEKGKFSELTITPFPAAPEASLLKKDIKLGNHWTEGKDFAAHITTGQNPDGSWWFNAYSEDHNTGKQGSFKTESQAVTEAKKFVKQNKYDFIKQSEEYWKDDFSSKDTEMSKKKNKVLINGQEPHVQLSEGDKSMDKEKMKKHMMEVQKMGEKEAEEKLAKCTEEEMKKMAAEAEEHEKKMAQEKPEEKKEMSEEKPEEKKEMSEAKEDEKKEMSKEEEDEKKDLAKKEEEDKKEMESAEKDKKLSAARESIVRLSADFRKAFEGAQLAAKKGKIVSRLSSLKASAKITPAEIKKIDVERLASQGDETVDLVLKTYEDREPVVMTGALGSIKADELHRLSNEIRMSRLEAETRKNMSLLKNTVKTRMQEEEKGGEVSIHVDTTPHVDQEIEMAYGSVCKMMDEGKLAEAKELLKKYMMKPKSEGRMDMVEHDKQLSALAEESIKMQNKFDELQKLAVTLVG